jgi:hypothetical protein
MKGMLIYGNNQQSNPIAQIQEIVTVAARDGDAQVLSQLMRGDFGLDEGSFYEIVRDALFTAAFHRQIGALEILLDSGRTDISGLLNYAVYPMIADELFIVAARDGNFAKVNQLVNDWEGLCKVNTAISLKEYVNAKDQMYGRTALMVATINGHKDIIELLRHYGADASSIMDKFGKTALDYAGEYYPDAVALLADHTMAVEFQDHTNPQAFGNQGHIEISGSNNNGDSHLEST